MLERTLGTSTRPPRRGPEIRPRQLHVAQQRDAAILRAVPGVLRPQLNELTPKLTELRSQLLLDQHSRVMPRPLAHLCLTPSVSSLRTPTTSSPLRYLASSEA